MSQSELTFSEWASTMVPPAARVQFVRVLEQMRDNELASFNSVAAQAVFHDDMRLNAAVARGRMDMVDDLLVTLRKAIGI